MTSTASGTRFHLDESVTSEVARALKKRGIDCTSTAEAGLRGAGDQVQFSFAVAQLRVLITADDDFLAIAAERQEHSGLIYWRRERHLGQFVFEVSELAAIGEPEDFANKVIFLR